MKLTIKSLKQVPYDVEVESDKSLILDLKLAMEQKHNFDHKTLKLLFNGVVLDDTKALIDCNIKEGNVIVMMSAKAKPINVGKEETKSEEKPPQTTTTTQSNTTNVSGNISQPKPKQEKDYSAQVKDLMDMGFPKTESESAIRTAKGNVSLAIEFLYNGIPEGINIPEEGESGEGGQGSTSPQAVLKNIASIVKVMCYNNPSQLQNILMTLQQTSPELMAVIRDNEDEFKSLIQQPITEDDVKNFQEFTAQTRGQGGSSQLGGTSGTSGSQQGESGRRDVIKLSKQDYDSVGRLKELGFSEMDSVQAFFACDKNEDMAANLLWENKLRDGEQEMYIDCNNCYNI